MAQAVLITLTAAGSDTGPFDLYSNLDGYTVPFESAIPKLDLEAGYISYLVPDGAMNIRVQSTNVLCENYVDLTINTTTTTTSTSTSSTTTTTTTLAPGEYDYYLADQYNCGSCDLLITNIVVAVPMGESVVIDNFYQSSPISGNVYKIKSLTTGSTSILIDHTINGSICSTVLCGG